jgi:hypothetical protein
MSLVSSASSCAPGRFSETALRFGFDNQACLWQRFTCRVSGRMHWSLDPLYRAISRFAAGRSDGSHRQSG